MDAKRMSMWTVALLFGANCFAAKEAVPLTPPPPPTNVPPAITLQNFKLTGEFNGDRASFTLTAKAKVDNAKGGSLELLSGTVALTGITTNARWHLRVDQNRVVAAFDRDGVFPVQIKFNTAVRRHEGWKSVDFRVAPSVLQPFVLRGLAADTQFRFAGAARAERKGDEFLTYLASDGVVNMSWQEVRPEAEGKLFYAAEMLSQINVGPGLMRQTALFDFKVMQGEMNRVTLLLRGAGEVTRVQGEQVLSWKILPASGSSERSLVVQFNQAQKDQFALQVQTQTPLGAFPQTADAMQLRPEGATRFAGFFRVVNDGAVRLEVVQANGLSQISPEQFPETGLTKSAFRTTGGQRFAYRFSGGEVALRIQADQTLPELTVSQILAYRLGENELAADAEFELEIREAPLRELLLQVPKGYAIAQITANGLADYFLREPADQPGAELRLVFAQPVSGRQVIGLRLERNQALGSTNWTLPRIEVAKAKSVRGNVGVSADAGFRLTSDRTQGLTETATAFFPRKVSGLQAAFRISDAAWTTTLRVERLPQTVQADVFHLFSIGEGIAYGSSVMNYVVSGAPVSAFRVELSDEYFNVEFTGADVRNWQKVAGGYLVQLHAPVAGPYTLLASYERPFKAQGETLAFTGARPLDAQSEQGHTVIISANQFQVKAADVSPGLLPLETGEVPPEYRLFFDAPILAAYRYAARPFNLKLALSPLVQGDSLNQVVERASLVTRVSKEGQVITDATYFLKNRGNPSFRLTLPEGTQLWSALVNGASVVPVVDGKDNLVRLPQSLDPNAVLKVELKLASRSSAPERVTVVAPKVNAPEMLAEWKLEPDAGQRLIFRHGTHSPVGGETDVSGFAGLARLFAGNPAGPATTQLVAALLLLLISVIVWRMTGQEGVHRFSARHVVGTIVGLGAFVLAVVALVNLSRFATTANAFVPRNVTFLAPVKQAGSVLSVEVANIEDKATVAGMFAHAWPALLALGVWVWAWSRGQSSLKAVAAAVGWTLVVWAALRSPNSAAAFFGIVIVFAVLHVLIPALRRLSRLPAKPTTAPETDDGGAAPAVTALLIGGLVLFNAGCATMTNSSGASRSVPAEKPVVESISQSVRVEDQFALVTTKLRWPAAKGQSLSLLSDPAVLTRASYPSNSLKLVQATIGGRRTRQLLALASGTFDLEVQYQLRLEKRDTENGFALPTQPGLINEVQVTVAGLDVDVQSTQAVSIERSLAGTNTVAKLVLSPAIDTWIGWKPRSRDVKRETAVFYAEVSQLYVPSAGMIEGVHHAAIRPAQGELNELTFTMPDGATVTDVAEATAAERSSGQQVRQSAALVSLWRFDPDTRKLRVTFNTAQSRPFALTIRSQVATGPLPFEQSVGLVSVEGAAGQIGLLGLATGNEVQLDSVSTKLFSPINLEDFPTAPASALQSQVVGLTVRRAFRYADTKATTLIKAAPVEPDVRVEMQNTLSLGEDRTVLASTLTVDITRAGIFRLSFVMPEGFDVESISGAALSHWTELKSDAGRVITLHLRGKTEGRQQFAVNLAGLGVKSAGAWAVPQLVLREAGKQQGSLVIVPEQGMQLQAATLEGVSQLDPQRSGIRQKGVLAFRVLQTPWNLALKIEQVAPWIQVTSLQQATVNEATVKIAANLQYQIENTGLKAFHVLVPTNADSVRFQGELIADFLPVAGTVTNGLQRWDVRLQRRVIGQHLLQVTYQTLIPEQSTETVLRGVQAAEVNLQRGFVTVQSAGRLQLRADTLPVALQPAEWQSIPRALQKNLPASSANFAYRMVEPAFALSLNLERHDAVKLLPARVQKATFTSAVSDDGVMLTQVRLEMQPGDKRLLHLTLPKDARFWYAFVNQNGVWPWRDQDRILIPLEQAPRGGAAIPVEIFFSSQVGRAGGRELDLELLAPKFDLPLEDISWRVHLGEKWELKKWAGTLQLEREELAPAAAVAFDVDSYLRSEAAQQREQTEVANRMLSLGNTALQQGDPQEARRAFQSAWSLSKHDNAFNEDARVQLNNLKVQQALVGLNVRQELVTNANATINLNGRVIDPRNNAGVVNYSQQDAKQLIERRSAEDNAALMRLAERIIQQQDAAATKPDAIRATIPTQGRVLTFKRAVAVDTWADLHIGLEAAAVRTAGWGIRAAILGGVFVLLAAFAGAGRKFAAS